MKKKPIKSLGANVTTLYGVLIQEQPVQRVSFGKLMPADESTISYPNPQNIGSNTKTGLIGYVDFVYRKYAVRIPSPDEGEGSVEILDALVMENLGVEGKNRKRGYARHMIQYVETLARKKNLGVIVGQSTNKLAEGLLVHLGYHMVDRDAIKILSQD